MTPLNIAQEKNMCDDLFDDVDPENVVLEKSWMRKIEDLSKEGYREGIDAGKEESVQQGFNEAFAVAAKLLFQVAKLRGNISGRLSANLLKPGTLMDKTESQLQELLQNVCLLESELLDFSENAYTQIKQATEYTQPSNEVEVLKFSEKTYAQIKQATEYTQPSNEAEVLKFSEKTYAQIKQATEYTQPSNEADVDKGSSNDIETASHAASITKTDQEESSTCTENVRSTDSKMAEYSVEKETCMSEKSHDESESLSIKQGTGNSVGDPTDPQSNPKGEEIDLCNTLSVVSEDSGDVKSGHCRIQHDSDSCDSIGRQEKQREETHPFLKRLEELTVQYKAIYSQ